MSSFVNRQQIVLRSRLLYPLTRLLFNVSRRKGAQGIRFNAYSMSWINFPLSKEWLSVVLCFFGESSSLLKIKIDRTLCMTTEFSCVDWDNNKVIHKSTTPQFWAGLFTHSLAFITFPMLVHLLHFVTLSVPPFGVFHRKKANSFRLAMQISMRRCNLWDSPGNGFISFRRVQLCN